MKTRAPLHASLPRHRLIAAMVFQREALAFRLRRRHGLPNEQDVADSPRVPEPPHLPPQDHFTLRALALLRTGDATR